MNKALLLSAAALFIVPQVCEARAKQFNVPSQDLATALRQFALQSGSQVVFLPKAVAGRKSRQVTGSFETDAALRRILKDADVRFRRTGNAYIIAMSDASMHAPTPAAAPAPQAAIVTAPADIENEAAEEIIVTARKREETSIAVPVVLTALSARDIEQRGISNIDGIARLVPQMVSGEAGGIIGGNIAIRGISGADSNPFGEQAVTFNVDGVQVARATVRRMAEMDLAQVEVLKGPQALFFGKNSPGGIISIRTADPTSNFEAKTSVGYEFNAHEWRAQGHVAGPLTEELGFRLTGYFSHMRGWLTNTAPTTGPFAPHDRHVPNGEDIGVRGTLKWDPVDNFSARFKLGFMKTDNSGVGSNNQVIHCPTGAPQFGGSTDCEADDKVSRADLGPNFAKVHPIFGDGIPYFKQRQFISSLELRYDASDEVQFVSLTGLYDLSARILENYGATPTPTRILASRGRYDITEISEELRVQTSYDGPLNMLAGAHFQDVKLSNGTVVAQNGLAPILLNDYFLVLKGEAYSAFAQLSFKPIEVLELTAGGRYTHERKRLTKVIRFNAPLPSNFPRKDKWHDFSPEVAITYRPTDALTVFGAYKHGFLSGGFNAGSSNFAGDLRYDQQTIKGFEGGIKAALLDRRLRVNLAAYRYNISGLQVSTLILQNNLPVQTISNAGKVQIKGAEFDFNYRTPIQGLKLHGAVAYNRARYKIYNAPCYRGQSQAQGCNLAINAAGLGTLQDLAGEPLPRAPKWAGNIGFEFEHGLGSGLELGLSAVAVFSGSYVGDTKNQPFDRQDSYKLFDATARLAAADDAWEVAIIGRNLGNKYYHSRAGELGGTGTVGGTINPGLLADLNSLLNRGREIMLRLTVRTGR